MRTEGHAQAEAMSEIRLSTFGGIGQQKQS
jgi:hypothetical protein